MTSRDAAVTSRIMAAVKSSGTRPEMALRRELHRRGLRYRVQTRIFGKPDIIFVRQRVACFVDGDRWHGNGWRTRGLASFDAEFAHRNSAFWKTKIESNMRRDREVTQILTAEGWTVVRIWESEVLADLAVAADRVAELVRRHGETASIARQVSL